MTLSALQLAGALPKNPRFREWCGEREERHAAEFIRERCGVMSRRDIATNPEAAQRFHNLIRRPFVEYLEQLKEPA
jgi:hypothetical protein